MYYGGRVAPENYISSYAWFSLAKISGDKDAIPALEAVKTIMTKQQIAEGQALAAKCYKSNYKDCD